MEWKTTRDKKLTNTAQCFNQSIEISYSMLMWHFLDSVPPSSGAM